MSCGVYMIYNKADNKRYIGSSIDIKERRKVHLRALKNNNHYNIHLQRAFNKYGRKSFKFKILKLVIQDKLLKVEQHYLDNFNSLYNVSPQARGGKHSEKTKEKISKAMKGKKHTQETKEKISKLQKGRKYTQEVKERMSKSSKDKKHTQETKEKISKAMRGRKLSEKTKKKISRARKGRKYTQETKDKISKGLKGLKGLKYRRKIQI